MEQVHRTILQKNRTLIIQNMANPDVVNDLLFEKNLFTESMQQEVESHGQIQGHIAQVRKILEYVLRRGPTAFNTFYETLIESSNEMIADILRSELRGSHPHVGGGERGYAIPQEDMDLPSVIQDEGSTKVANVTNQANVECVRIQEAGDKSLQVIQDEGKTNVAKVMDQANVECVRIQEAGDKALQVIQDEGSTKVANVTNQANVECVRIQEAGDKSLQVIQDEGKTNVAKVMDQANVECVRIQEAGDKALQALKKEKEKMVADARDEMAGEACGVIRDIKSEVIQDEGKTNVAKVTDQANVECVRIQEAGDKALQALKKEKEKMVADARDEMAGEACGVIRDIKSEAMKTKQNKSEDEIYKEKKHALKEEKEKLVADARDENTEEAYGIIRATKSKAIKEEKEMVVADARDEITEEAYGIIRATKSEVKEMRTKICEELETEKNRHITAMRMSLKETADEIYKKRKHALKKEKEKVVADARDEMTEEAYGIIGATKSEAAEIKTKICEELETEKNRHITGAIQESNSTSLPAEIQRLNKASIALYKAALKDGKEEVYSVRVMIVGHFGVGKTTLRKRLMGCKVNVGKGEIHSSTNGIEVNVCSTCLPLNSIGSDGRQWTPETKEHAENHLHRLNQVVRRMDQGNNSSEDGTVSHTSTQTVTETRVLNQRPDPPTHDRDATDDTHLKEYFQDNMTDLKYVDEEGRNVQLSVWDFAGQHAFYSTHQVFMSRRAIYLLVTDASQNWKDEVDDDCYLDTNGKCRRHVSDFVEFWLNSIHEFSGANISGKPPVILVATHADMLKHADKDGEKAEYFKSIRERLINKEVNIHVADEQFLIDNSMADPNIGKLKDTILQIAQKQVDWGKPRPARWLTLEHEFAKLRAQNVKVLGMKKLLEINGDLPVPLKSQEEINLFLVFQHDVGEIIYFNDEVLKDNIILKPQWLIDAFKRLITADKHIPWSDVKNSSMWKDFRLTAKMKWEFADVVWNCEEFKHHTDIIIIFMERLGLVARSTPHGKKEPLADKQTTIFVPCVLKEEPPKSLFEKEDGQGLEVTSKLCFTNKNKFIPAAIFHKLLARCMSQWPLEKKNQKYHIYCGCGVFDLGDADTLYVYFYDNIVHIWISRCTLAGTRNEKLLAKCKEVKAFVENFFQNVARMTSPIETFVKCPRSPQRKDEDMWRIDGQDIVKCTNCTNDHALKLSELASYWFTAKQPDTDRWADRIPTNKELVTIAQHIGHGKEMLAVELGISKATFEQIEADYKCSEVLQIYNVLLRWKDATGGMPNDQTKTLRSLQEVLIKSGVTIVWDGIHAIIGQNIVQSRAEMDDSTELKRVY